MATYEVTFNEKTDFGKNLLTFLTENKKYVKVKDHTKMTKEEFFAKLDKAKKQCERGEYTVYNKESFREFLEAK